MSESAATGAEGFENAGTEVAGTNAPAAGAVTGSPPSPSAAPAPSGDDPFGDLPSDQAVFDRGYVDKVRREGARFRNELRDTQGRLSAYDDVFGIYEEPDRDVWFDLARSWASDPRQAAAVMQQIASAVLGEGDEQGTEAPADSSTRLETSAAGATGPLTQEQIAELVRAEVENADYQRRQEAMVDTIYDTIRTAGYEPKSAEGMAILWTANNETEGDIEKAIEKYNAVRQQAVDDYVAGRARSGRPTPAPSNGVVASAHTPIQNLEDARRAADAYLRAQVGGSS